MQLTTPHIDIQTVHGITFPMHRLSADSESRPASKPDNAQKSRGASKSRKCDSRRGRGARDVPPSFQRTH